MDSQNEENEKTKKLKKQLTIVASFVSLYVYGVYSADRIEREKQRIIKLKIMNKAQWDKAMKIVTDDITLKK